jgi:hypothetical protein
LGSCDVVESLAEEVEGRLLVEGAAGTPPERLVHPLQRDPLGAARKFESTDG